MGARQETDRDLAAHLLPPYGRPAAIENVGVAAAPLLAGFSVALVGLILQIEDVHERIAKPDIALGMLVTAALLLINAVQCAFHARQYHVPYDEWESLVKLFPEGARRDQLLANQIKWLTRQAKWVERTRLLYNLGVLVLFGAVAVTLLPPGPVRDINEARLVALGITVGGLLIEFAWVLSGQIESLRNRLRLRKVARALEAERLRVATCEVDRVAARGQGPDDASPYDDRCSSTDDTAPVEPDPKS